MRSGSPGNACDAREAQDDGNAVSLRSSTETGARRVLCVQAAKYSCTPALCLCSAEISSKCLHSKAEKEPAQLRGTEGAALHLWEMNSRPWCFAEVLCIYLRASIAFLFPSADFCLALEAVCKILEGLLLLFSLSAVSGCT